MIQWTKIAHDKKQRLHKRIKSAHEEELKQQSTKITVTFDRCKVKEEKTYITKRIRDFKTQGLKALMHSRYAEITTENIYSTIEVEVEVNGSLKIFKSSSLPIDRENLLIKLYMQKEITIYYNSHTRKYFFDLSFLD